MSCCLHCEIGDLHTRFGRALDRGEVDDWVELFAPDARYDNGRTVLHGHDELRAWITRRVASGQVRTTRHVWSGLQLEPIDDRTLTSESIWVCYAANRPSPVDEVSIWSVADFTDTIVRVEGRWRIATRTIRTVFRDPAVAPRI